MRSPESQPTNIDNKLLDRILYELRTFKREDDSEVSMEINQIFGSLLQNSLNLKNCSRTEFTKALDLEREFTDALLDGYFPVSEIEDAFLEEIAEFVGQDMAIFKAILQFQKPAARKNRPSENTKRPTQNPCNEKHPNHPQAFLKSVQFGNSV